ncbi:HAMP domain-containing sensor histidine kinase [Nocardioides marmorisolisilvae]|uniref:histidine kinase n=1 Tax=Nocardioides marmorisolisilvae TaxID=1542737 RepID=A0A3N0DSD3_9ACTN|nr:histidine kinase [Nocardioides marmorisolisilvae]RNL78530.1 HAMP domain-containing protein [Nocardioides marmorisolisilvae]
MERGIEAWLVGLYERRGAVDALFRLMWMIVPIATAVGLSLQSRYLGLSLVRSLVCASIIFAVLIVSTIWSMAAFRRDIGENVSGEGGLLLEFPIRLVRAVAPRLIPLTVPALMITYAVAADDWTLVTLAGTAGGALITIATAAAGIYAAASTMTGLIAAKTLNLDRPAHADLGLAPRLALYLGVLSTTCGSVVGALTITPGDPGALLRTYGLSIAVAIVFLLTVTIPATMAVRNPVRQLIAGARAVTAGDHEFRVPVSSADELGELAATFNSMISALQTTSDGLRASLTRVQVASDQARRKVERDLHDGAQQSLLLLNLKLGMIERIFHDDPQAAAAMLAEARVDLSQALKELRDLAHGVYPEILVSDGVPAALKSVGGAQMSRLECREFGRYATEVEAAIYFCCLEAIQNAAKHAGEGAKIWVRLDGRGSSLQFEVRDNGRGFDPETVSQDSFQNMSDRIGALNGSMLVDSVPGQGTKVSGSVPRVEPT